MRFFYLLYNFTGFSSNHRFIATELFRMVQGPHSSGNLYIYIYILFVCLFFFLQKGGHQRRAHGQK